MLTAAANIEGVSTLRKMESRNSQMLGAYQPILLAVVLEDVVVATVIVIPVSATCKCDGTVMRGRVQM